MICKSAKENDGLTAKTPVILALEASGDLLAAAVWVDGAVQNHQAHLARHGHAAHIATLVAQVMKMAGIAFLVWMQLTEAIQKICICLAQQEISLISVEDQKVWIIYYMELEILIFLILGRSIKSQYLD